MISRLGRAFRRARAWQRRRSDRRTRPHAVVLLYHRIASPRHDPWHLAVSPQNFQEQLGVLSGIGEVVRLGDLRKRLTRPLSRPLIALTFDDGYVDNLSRALPALAKSGMPATVFVATGWTGRDLPFWWDRLAWYVLSPDELPTRLDLELATGRIRWSSRRGRHHLHRALWRGVRFMEDPEREQALGAVLEWSGAAAASPNELGRPMTESELQMLGDGGLVELGGHSVTHPVLPALPPDRQRSEILDSMEACRRLTGQMPEAFAYPSGECGPKTWSLARECGVSLACTGHHDLVWADTEPLAIPRFSVRNAGGDAFARWMHRYVLP